MSFSSFKVLCLSVLVLALCGCQSGEITTQNVKIITQPAGALVRINGIEVGKTPMNVELSTHFDTELQLEKEGFKSERVVVGGKGNKVIKPNPVRVNFIPAFIPDDPGKIDPAVCRQTFEWMQKNHRYEAADLQYMEQYLKKNVK